MFGRRMKVSLPSLEDTVRDPKVLKEDLVQWHLNYHNMLICKVPIVTFPQKERKQPKSTSFDKFIMNYKVVSQQKMNQDLYISMCTIRVKKKSNSPNCICGVSDNLHLSDLEIISQGASEKKYICKRCALNPSS